MNEHSSLRTLRSYVKKYAHVNVALGMKLTKIYGVLKFKQSDWMKNISILTLKKEQILLIVLRKFFLN